MYRWSGQRGFTPSVSGDPRHVTARKFEREVGVRFASSACSVQTPEGVVHAKPGDAVITGVGAFMHLIVHTLWLSLITMSMRESHTAGDGADASTVKASIQAAVALILEELEEHRDWHMLVHPHRLPLG